jgi:hypothetical protein
MLIKISENGDADLAVVDFKGNVSESQQHVTCQDLFEKYMPDKRKFPFEYAKYPQGSDIFSNTWYVDQHVKRISIAMTSTTKEYGHMNVLCRESPSRKAFALQAYKKGALVLVPISSKIKAIEKNTGKVSDNFIENLLTCGGDAPHGYSFHICPMVGGDNIVCPVWYLTSTDDAKLANLKVSMVVNRVSTQIGDDGDNEAWDIKLPTFTNTKALNESDELIYHMPKKDKKEKASNKRPFDAM